MPDKGTPATGPIILEKLLQVAADVRDIKETQDRRARQFSSLSEQLDSFLAAELNWSGTLVQLREVYANQNARISELTDQVRRLERTVQGALQLAAGDPARTERNGN